MLAVMLVSFVFAEKTFLQLMMDDMAGELNDGHQFQPYPDYFKDLQTCMAKWEDPHLE